MKLIMPALEFVSADDAPDEWKDGRQLLAFGDYGWNGAAGGRCTRLWAVVFFAAEWKCVKEWQVVTAEGDCRDCNAETDVNFCPAWLAELPVNMEAKEVTE